MEHNEKKAMKVSAVSIIVNLLLSLFKLVAGIMASSGAMISDAIHSASDVFSSIVVMIGVVLSSKESDKEHQYGHERIECVVAIILSVILLATGLAIGYAGIKAIIHAEYEHLETPGRLALVAAVVSVLVKEMMYWYTRAVAKQINSSALMADAWHHRSDSLSSIGAFVGILGARMAAPVLDSVASVVICVFIGKAAFDIFMDAVKKMLDTSCDDEVVKEMVTLILEHEGVDIDEIRTRLFGSKIYVEIEIALDGDMTLKKAHDIAEEVHDDLEEKFPLVKHCMVHVNPK